MPALSAAPASMPTAGSTWPRRGSQPCERPLKKPATNGPASSRVAGDGSHLRAGGAELALTWGPMPSVVAPQEHPFAVGLRSKREAGCRVRQAFGHALTEALHVPLHLERWCRFAAEPPPSRAVWA